MSKQTLSTDPRLSQGSKYIAADFASVKPRKIDQNRNPGIDVMAVWRADIEHSIKCRNLSADEADAFRAACGA